MFIKRCGDPLHMLASVVVVCLTWINESEAGCAYFYYMLAGAPAAVAAALSAENNNKYYKIISPYTFIRSVVVVHRAE